MKKLLMITVLVSTVSQMTQGYEPGPVIPTNKNIGGTPGRQIIKTGGGVQQDPNLAAKLKCMRAGNNWNPFTNTCSMPTGGGVQKLRPGQNGGGVQKSRPGQNGGGVQILNTKGGIQNLESRRKALRDLCFRHDKAYIVRKGQVGRCLPSSRPGQNGGGVRKMTGNKAGGSF